MVWLGVMPLTGQPIQSIPCSWCGEVFTRRSPRRSLCSLRCALLSRVSKDGPVHPYRKSLGNCWVWAGGTEHGYGRMSFEGKMRYTHQVSYELFVGPIPDHDSYHGMCVCHSCNNSLCANPSHLVLGTQGDNVAYMDKSGRRARRILSDLDVEGVRFLLSQGHTPQKDIATAFGVSPQLICDIKKGRRHHAKLSPISLPAIPPQ